MKNPLPLILVHRAIADAGIPVVCVRESPAQPSFDLAAEATPEQHAAAQAIYDAADWTAAEARPESAIVADVAALDSTDKAALIDQMLASFLRSRPDVAAGKVATQVPKQGGSL